MPAQAPPATRAVLALRSHDGSLMVAAEREWKNSPVARVLREQLYLNDPTVTTACLELDDAGDRIPVDVELRVSLSVDGRKNQPLWLVCRARRRDRMVLEVQYIQYPRARELLLAACHSRLRDKRFTSRSAYGSELARLWEATFQGKATTSDLRSDGVISAVEAIFNTLEQEDLGQSARLLMGVTTLSEPAMLASDIATVRRTTARAVASRDHVPASAASGDLSALMARLRLLADVSRALVDLLDHEGQQPPNPDGGSGRFEDRGDCDPPVLTTALASTSDLNLANMLDGFHRSVRKHVKNNLVFGSLMEEAITSIVRSWLPSEVRVSSGSVLGLISTPDPERRSKKTRRAATAEPQEFQVDLVFWTPTRAQAVVEAGGVAVVPPVAVLGLMEIKAGQNPWTKADIESLSSRIRWLRHRLTCLQFESGPSCTHEPVRRVPALGMVMEVNEDLYDIRMNHHRLVTALADKPRDAKKRWVRPGVIGDLRHFVQHEVLGANGFAAQTEPQGHAPGR